MTIIELFEMPIKGKKIKLERSPNSYIEGIARSLVPFRDRSGYFSLILEMNDGGTSTIALECNQKIELLESLGDFEFDKFDNHNRIKFTNIIDLKSLISAVTVTDSGNLSREQRNIITRYLNVAYEDINDYDLKNSKDFRLLKCRVIYDLIYKFKELKLSDFPKIVVSTYDDKDGNSKDVHNSELVSLPLFEYDKSYEKRYLKISNNSIHPVFDIENVVINEKLAFIIPYYTLWDESSNKLSGQINSQSLNIGKIEFHKGNF